MNFLVRTKAIASEKGLTIKDLEKQLGLSNGYIHTQANTTSITLKIKKIADFLGVSPMLLVYGEVDNNMYSDTNAMVFAKVFANFLVDYPQYKKLFEIVAEIPDDKIGASYEVLKAMSDRQINRLQKYYDLLKKENVK